MELSSAKDVDDSRSGTESTISTVKSESNFKNMKFISGSEWIGEWEKLGMSGMGVYKMPHGVIYEGSMNAGVFEGIGVLTYPNGGSLEGFWHEGKLKYCQYEYADGLKRDSPLGWTYCQMPDRRFYTEMLRGLRPASQEQVTNEDPPRELPAGMYDVGDGFYNPRTKCVTDPHSGEVLRIPIENEEKWILENARKADIGTVGYRPDLYENWFKERGTDATQGLPDYAKGLLSLILQEDGSLESRDPSWRSSQDRSFYSTSKNESFKDLKSFTSMWSRSTTVEFEGLMKKILRDRGEFRQGYSHMEEVLSREEPEVRESDEYSIVKLLHDIALSYSGQIDRVLYNSEKLSRELSRESSKPPSALSSAPLPSHMSVSTHPFSYSYPGSLAENKVREVQRSISKQVGEKQISNDANTVESAVRLNIDYSDFANYSTSRDSSDI